ncbi:MAG: UxaA family hydrolase, partial [candidate division NC10 bacterium]|nr:UxaA family hydrolase [candidate division NC10 bacterium]
ADLELVTRTLIHLGQNPNLGAVLLVSLGCEGVNPVRVAEGIASSGKPVEIVRVQQEGGYFGALAEGGLKSQKMAQAISALRREEVGVEELVLGLKCGASDPTSGLAANPALGKAVDRLIELGGTAIFGETTEVVGAEHLLAKRAKNPEVAEKLLSLVERLEKRVKASGSDIRGGNPSAGNIAGGITTLEEKSLGSIVKSGSGIIEEVYEYGERRRGRGLFFVDSPGREPEIIAGLAAAGCQVIAFATGLGAPQGFPFVPVLKICANWKTIQRLPDFIDLDVSGVVSGEESLEEAGERILAEILQVASGKSTKAEALGYSGSTNLYTTGPIV